MVRSKKRKVQRGGVLNLSSNDIKEIIEKYKINDGYPMDFIKFLHNDETDYNNLDDVQKAWDEYNNKGIVADGPLSKTQAEEFSIQRGNLWGNVSSGGKSQSKTKRKKGKKSRKVKRSKKSRKVKRSNKSRKVKKSRKSRRK